MRPIHWWWWSYADNDSRCHRHDDNDERTYEYDHGQSTIKGYSDAIGGYLSATAAAYCRDHDYREDGTYVTKMTIIMIKPSTAVVITRTNVMMIKETDMMIKMNILEIL